MARGTRDVVGVILAGGRGTRMAPFSLHYPKPMLPICNKPLLEYHIDTMRESGIKEVFVVIGHLGYEIARQLGSGDRLGMNIEYIEQTDALGIAHALGQLQPYVKSPILLFLGDIFFRTSGMKEMIATFRSRDSGSFLVVKEDVPEAIQRNFAVILDPGTGRVQRVIEKPRYIHNSLKGCGLYLFDLPIFDAIRRTPRTAMRDEYEITDAIQILIDDGEPVEIAKVVDEDVNLTTPYDLLGCNMSELDRRGLDNLIDKTAEVSPSATIRHSIIGPGARIEAPAVLEDCVVFADTVIDRAEGRVHGYIVTPEAAIECRPPMLA